MPKEKESLEINTVGELPKIEKDGKLVPSPNQWNRLQDAVKQVLQKATGAIHFRGEVKVLHKPADETDVKGSVDIKQVDGSDENGRKVIVHSVQMKGGNFNALCDAIKRGIGIFIMRNVYGTKRGKIRQETVDKVDSAFRKVFLDAEGNLTPTAKALLSHAFTPAKPKASAKPPAFIMLEYFGGVLPGVLVRITNNQVQLDNQFKIVETLSQMHDESGDPLSEPIPAQLLLVDRANSRTFPCPRTLEEIASALQSPIVEGQTEMETLVEPIPEDEESEDESAAA
jgi:hypothetical protein